MIRFAAISDIQYADMEPSDGRDYRASYNKFLEAAGDITTARVDFALNLGDSFQEKWENALSVKQLFEISQDKGKINWIHVLGNHDFLVPDKNKKQVYGLFNLSKPGYYEYKPQDSDDPSNKWRILVLNGNEISTYAAENEDERNLAQGERERLRLTDGSLPKDFNGAISVQQLNWLDDRLQYATSQGENVLVASHFPLYAGSKSLTSNRGRLASLLNVGIFYSNLGVSTWNGQEILSVLDKYKLVRCFIAGHLHTGSYGVRNNVAHITLKGVIEASPNAFCYIELHPDQIILRGIGAQPSYQHVFSSEVK